MIEAIADTSSVALSSHAAKLHPGTLQVRVVFANGPRRGSGLSLPDHVAEKGSRDLADQRVRQRWVPYVIVEYENFQRAAEASFWSDHGVAAWCENGLFSFDMGSSSSISSEAIISLSVRSSSATAVSSRHELLGSARFNPFAERWTAHPGSKQRIDLDGGLAGIQLKISWVEHETPPLEHYSWHIHQEYGCEEFVQVEKETSGKGANLQYGMTTYTEDASHDGPDVDQLSHPFLAPLAVELKSLGKVHLLSRIADGGHLFSHLQRARRFDVEKTVFYAAELVCVLGYLHEKRVVASLRPENIVVDPFGHISICSAGLYRLDQQARIDRIAANNQEFPAPEPTHGNRPTPIGDWRELGNLICEMLTGLPPINDEERAITEPDMALPEELPATTRDFIHRMLSNSSASCLGMKGSTEIMSHPFFHGVNWEDIESKRTSPYRPVPLGIPAVFKMEPGKRKQDFDDREEWTGVRRRSRGCLYEEFSFVTPCVTWERIGRIRSAATDNASETALDLARNDDWDVDWDAEVRKFYFKNRLTNDNRLAFLDRADPAYIGWRRSSSAGPSAERRPPSQGDLLEALAYALRFEYSATVFSQLLAYGVDLNTSILQYTDDPDTHMTPATPDKIALTPLEWAAEHGRHDLVQLFLGAAGGADANYSAWETRGPALRRAAYRGDRSMVEALYPKTTNRASRTRALSAAADRGDVAMATVLLDLGAPCDFAESDRPLPVDRDIEGQYAGLVAPPLQAKHFYPPLVVAIWRGDAAMVRLLLGHGADPNLAYHGLERRRRERYEEKVLPVHEEPFFSCGRPAQLAMELDHGEIVDLLLEAGADVELPHGYWTARPPGELDTLSMGHICPLVPRKVYLAVTAGLREAAQSRTRSAESRG